MQSELNQSFAFQAISIDFWNTLSEIYFTINYKTILIIVYIN